MAQTKVIMPQMGESVAEGTVAKWLKSVGDKVERDENILEISTDKIDVEVPVPQAGFIRQILVKEGETVEVGTPLAIIADSMAEPVDESAPVTEAKVPVESPAEQPSAPPEEQPTPEPAIQPERKTVEKPIIASEERGSGDKRKFYTPVVLRMAAEHNIDLEKVAGTGIAGRVTKKDVLNYLKEGPVAAPTPGAIVSTADGAVEIIQMNNARKKTAEHMVFSKRTSAHVTTMQEVDLTPIVRYRESVKDEFKKNNGYPLTYMAIITKEVCETIKDFPIINSSVEGDKIIVKKNINIGMAVALADETLIVPVIKNADLLSISGLAKAIYDLANKARNRKLTMDDIQGGTYTITNHGIFGSVFGTPIINQPQVAVLGTGALKKRPVVIEGKDGDYLAIRSMMFLSLSYDHRIIDGSYGGKFCNRLVERLESWDPSRM